MISLARALTMFAAALSLSFAACGGDDGGDDSGGDDMGTGPADDGGGDAPADDGADGPADDGADDAPADDGADDAPADDGGSGKALGEDCSASDECADGLCLMFEDMGMTYGFCTRSCTSADDCPESGWECNLAPYTACVPAG